MSHNRWCIQIDRAVVHGDQGLDPAELARVIETELLRQMEMETIPITTAGGSPFATITRHLEQVLIDAHAGDTESMGREIATSIHSQMRASAPGDDRAENLP